MQGKKNEKNEKNSKKHVFFLKKKRNEKNVFFHNPTPDPLDVDCLWPKRVRLILVMVLDHHCFRGLLQNLNDS